MVEVGVGAIKQSNMTFESLVSKVEPNLILRYQLQDLKAI